MKITFGFLLIILLQLACNQPKYNKEKKIISPAPTTDPSVLFFKNVRQPFYNTTEFPDEYLMIFRENTFTDKSSNHLIPTIFLNWRDDIAWIRLEPSSSTEINPIKIFWSDSTSSDKGIFLLDTSSTDHFPLIKSMSDHLSDNGLIFLIHDTDTIPVLTEKDEKRAFKNTLRDFLRLIESN